MTEFPNSQGSLPAGTAGAERFSASEHWSDEQFSNYMLGLELDPVTMQHLDACAVCQVEAEQFQSSVESFNDLSLEWSERQPHARMLIPEKKPGFGWLPTAAWAMAAAVVFTVGLPMALQHRNAGSEDRAMVAQADATQVASIADENSDAAIARDNKLMMAVAYELDRTDPTAAAYLANEPQSLKGRVQPRNQ